MADEVIVLDTARSLPTHVLDTVESLPDGTSSTRPGHSRTARGLWQALVSMGAASHHQVEQFGARAGCCSWLWVFERCDANTRSIRSGAWTAPTSRSPYPTTLICLAA